MILSVLDKVKEFLAREVSPTIKLPVAGKKGQEAGFTLAHPSVLVEWVDQINVDKGVYPELKDKSIIPCLLVCMDDADDTAVDLLINIRVVAVCWNPGTFTEERERVINGVGYYDLLNLLERVKQKIKGARSFEIATLEGGVRLRVYEEQPYPYWYGWLSFQARGFGDPYVPDLNF